VINYKVEACRPDCRLHCLLKFTTIVALLILPPLSILANTPLEWTGPHRLSAAPHQALCLPLRGSVRKIGKSKRQCHVGYPSGMAAVFGDELLYSCLPGGRLA
jgi:hypothetical protein